MMREPMSPTELSTAVWRRELNVKAKFDKQYTTL
jgi:hypothetical protein